VTFCVKDIALQTLLDTEGGVSIFLHSVGFQVPNFMVSHYWMWYYSESWWFSKFSAVSSV